MIQHVWERAKQSNVLDEVFIAVDDERVFDAVQEFGANVVMTSQEHASGTDRIAKAFRHSPARIIVNIQGDEPLIEPQVIDSLAHALSEDSSCQMATAIKAITDESELNDPNVVKVVVDKNNYALYFSRSPIPYNRDNKPFVDGNFYKHLGLYAYRKDFLCSYKDLPQSDLEEFEKLEQLRAVEAGYKIKTVETDYDSVSVDTPEDFERVTELMKQEETDDKKD